MLLKAVSQKMGWFMERVMPPENEPHYKVDDLRYVSGKHLPEEERKKDMQRLGTYFGLLQSTLSWSDGANRGLRDLLREKRNVFVD